MFTFENMIIIGGTGRNTGKTTLAEKLIEKFGKQVPVTAVKMANIKPGSEHFHGHKTTSFHQKIRIEQESALNGNKDSMRFLKAGAEISWYIQTKDEFLEETFPEIEKRLSSADWIICESNSLIHYVQPGIFIMVKGEETAWTKNVSGLLEKADVIVHALDEAEFQDIIRRTEISGNRFILAME
jgi:molybdopterin-guanine dinucleotide biosynthesis protein